MKKIISSSKARQTDRRILEKAVGVLDSAVPNPSNGLPDEVFYYISRMTPMVNVDLLVKDETGRTLLAWRNDPYAGRGWHLPGGIIRFLETLEERINQVALLEIGVPVTFNPAPLAINQIIAPKLPVRNHFISILYSCHLPGAFTPENKGLTTTDAGYLKWHESCPDDLLPFHNIYRDWFHKAQPPPSPMHYGIRHGA